MARAGFAFKMLLARLDPQRSRCPYCASGFYAFLQKKWVLIEARKCRNCGLIYRWPTDRSGETRSFYEKQYEGQQATHIPSSGELKKALESGFKGTVYDKSHRVRFIRKAVEVKTGALLDFGSSWGYGAFQYAFMGFDVSGFEINRRRVEFGRTNLRLDLHADWEVFEGKNRFDVIVCDHTLEHLPDIGDAIRKFERVSKQGAELVIFVPNGGCEQARRLGVKWGPFIGETHTVALTTEWFSEILPKHGFYPRFFNRDGERLEPREDSEEIALVAKKSG